MRPLHFYFEVCIVQDTWRLELSVGYERDLSSELVAYLRTLPYTDDSWTPAAAKADEERRAAERALTAKLRRVRALLRKSPAAWGLIEPAVVLAEYSTNERAPGGGAA